MCTDTNKDTEQPHKWSTKRQKHLISLPDRDSLYKGWGKLYHVCPGGLLSPNLSVRIGITVTEFLIHIYTGQLSL